MTANRYAYNFKVVIVMAEFSDLAEARKQVYETKERISKVLKGAAFHISGKPCYGVAQASPERRELFGHDGWFTAALVRVAQSPSLATEREYTGRGITVLACRAHSAYKNNNLDAAGGNG